MTPFEQFIIALLTVLPATAMGILTAFQAWKNQHSIKALSDKVDVNHMRSMAQMVDNHASLFNQAAANQKTNQQVPGQQSGFSIQAVQPTKPKPPFI